MSAKLVERDDALASLRRLFADCEAGRGRVALVNGALAAGKTELLHEFCQSVTEASAVVLSATGSRAESSLQGGVVSQLLHSTALPTEVAEHASRLVTVDTPSPAEADSDPLAIPPALAPLMHQMCTSLLRLAADRPVVIAIDDAHFADTLSLQALLYLRRRIMCARVLMIVSEWAQPYPRHALFRTELTRHPHHRITLAPLSADGVDRLLARQMDAVTGRRFAQACHALTGGNPLLVHALIDDNRTDRGRLEDEPGSTPEQPVVGDAFGQAVLECLHRWQPALLDVARGVAMLGERGSPAVIARLTGIRPDSIMQMLAILTTAGLLTDTHRLRHPAAAAAIVGSIAPEARAAMHGRAAEVLSQHGGTAIEVAAHLVAADVAPGPWAVDVLRDAARQALVDDEMDLAGRCLELALRACPDEQERLELSRGLALVHWRVNPSAAATHLPHLHAALRAGDLRGEDAVIVARQLLWQGDSEAVENAVRALNGSTDPADAQLGDELRLAYQWVHGSSRHLLPHAEAAPAARGGKPVPIAGNQWARASATLTTLFEQGASDEIVDSAKHILRRCRLGDATLEVVATALLVLVYADKLELAASRCDALLEEAVRSHATTWRAVLGSLRADIALRQGDLAEAETQARTALGLLPPQTWGVLIGYPVSVLLLAYSLTGQRAAGAELLKQVMPEAMFRTVFGLRYLHARGHYYLAADRVLAALGDFQTCGRLMKERDLDIPALVAWRSDLARAQLRLDRREVARDLVNEQLRQPRAIGFRTRGISLRVLAATSDLRQRLPLLREAINLLQGCGDRYQLARALAELSQAHHELGDFSRARMLARWAGQQAEACHPDALPRQLSAAQTASGDGEQADEQAEGETLPGLSDAELRVASLAALGHTNREISSRLYITVSTVEQHLTRVYRKLNVNSRADLPAGLSLNDVSASA